MPPRPPPLQEATHACRGLTRAPRARGCTRGAQAPAWEALRVLRTIDPQHATAIALEAGGTAKV